MTTYQAITMIDGQPTFEKPLSDILAECKRGGAIKILSPVEYVTDRQRRWYKGVCLRQLVKHDENGETVAWWDTEIKRKCGGLQYLKKEIFFLSDGQGIGRLTTKGVGVRNMTLFIEQILSQSMMEGWNISPPDKDLRK